MGVIECSVVHCQLKILPVIFFLHRSSCATTPPSLCDNAAVIALRMSSSLLLRSCLHGPGIATYRFLFCFRVFGAVHDRPSRSVTPL